MEQSFITKINFHLDILPLDILPKETKEALDWLFAKKWLKKSDWYLAGGTALALKAGHRQLVDVAVMKIIAISQRGKKRDFFDLYWCAKNIESLQAIIERLPAQYPSVAHNYHHILKSLVYFEDAESDPDPVIFFKADWKEVKNFFSKEIPIITKNLLKL